VTVDECETPYDTARVANPTILALSPNGDDFTNVHTSFFYHEPPVKTGTVGVEPRGPAETAPTGRTVAEELDAALVGKTTETIIIPDIGQIYITVEGVGIRPNPMVLRRPDNSTQNCTTGSLSGNYGRCGEAFYVSAESFIQTKIDFIDIKRQNILAVTRVGQVEIEGLEAEVETIKAGIDDDQVHNNDVVVNLKQAGINIFSQRL
jgi:hypothetical protein